MTKAAFHRAVPSFKVTLTAAVLATAGCSAMNTPTAQSIAGLPPSGSVTISEDFVAGLGGAAALWSTRGGPIHSSFSVLLRAPGAGLRKSALQALSTSSPASRSFQAGTRKVPAKPVSVLRAAAICGWRTAPA